MTSASSKEGKYERGKLSRYLRARPATRDMLSNNLYGLDTQELNERFRNHYDLLYEAANEDKQVENIGVWKTVFHKNFACYERHKWVTEMVRLLPDFFIFARVGTSGRLTHLTPNRHNFYRACTRRQLAARPVRRRALAQLQPARRSRTTIAEREEWKQEAARRQVAKRVRDARRLERLRAKRKKTAARERLERPWESLLSVTDQRRLTRLIDPSARRILRAELVRAYRRTHPDVRRPDPESSEESASDGSDASNDSDSADDDDDRPASAALNPATHNHDHDLSDSDSDIPLAQRYADSVPLSTTLKLKQAQEQKTRVSSRLAGRGVEDVPRVGGARTKRVYDRSVTRKRRYSPARSRITDAIDFLRSEHNNIRVMFRDIYPAQQPSAVRKRKFKNLVRFLTVHEHMEQRAWYPFLPVSKSLIQHFMHDEALAAAELRSFRSTPFESTEWWTKFDRLHRDVLHHASDEERNLFPAVARALSKPKLVKLKEQMQQYKRRH